MRQESSQVGARVFISFFQFFFFLMPSTFFFAATDNVCRMSGNGTTSSEQTSGSHLVDVPELKAGAKGRFVSLLALGRADAALADAGCLAHVFETREERKKSG